MTGKAMSEKIVIVDYGSGNLRSVQKAFERVITDTGASAHALVSDDPAQIANADRVVLPGVGAFGACMAGLSENINVVSALEHAVLADHKPFLGICVGMQLLADRGLEFGETPGLGWVAGDVKPLPIVGPDGADAGRLRVPHMGWNTVTFENAHPVFDGPADDFYFVHSYHFTPENDAHITGVCRYGETIVAAIARDNIVATQFHPEKSQAAGLALIGRFLNWRP